MPAAQKMLLVRLLSLISGLNIAPGLTEQIMNRVGTLHDVYTAADPERIAEHLVLSLRPRSPNAT